MMLQSRVSWLYSSLESSGVRQEANVKDSKTFKRMKVESNIWLWSKSALKVMPDKSGPTVKFPKGYRPRIDGDKVVIDGAGMETLLQARQFRALLSGPNGGPACTKT